jgi:hypothetical protein
VIHQSFKPLFTDSSHIKFDHPLPLFLLPVHLITPLRIGASASLHCICPNHLKQCCTSFSSTGVTPSLSRMSSFQTQSLLVWPQIHRSMRISATLSCWTCRLLVGYHSAPYNIRSVAKLGEKWWGCKTTSCRCPCLINVEIRECLHDENCWVVGPPPTWVFGPAHRGCLRGEGTRDCRPRVSP